MSCTLSINGEIREILYFVRVILVIIISRDRAFRKPKDSAEGPLVKSAYFITPLLFFNVPSPGERE